MATAGVFNRGGHFQHLRLPAPPFASPSSTAAAPANLPGSRRTVCKFWLQGRCNRRPCPFLHSREAPPTLPPARQRHLAPPRNRVWRNPNPTPASGGKCLPPPTPNPAPAPQEKCPPPPTAPPHQDAGDDGYRKGIAIIVLGEDAPECPPPPTPTPSDEDDDEEGREDTILIRHGEEDASECLPLPTTTLSPDDNGEDREVITRLSKDAPECLPPPASLPLGNNLNGGKKGGTMIALGEVAADLECLPRTPSPLDADEGGGPDCASLAAASLLTVLDGHRRPVTGVALPSGSSKLFSGSADGTVRIWDCDSGQCVQVIQLGGDIHCLITDGHWVFAGGSGGVCGCNTLTGAGVRLPGPPVEVRSLDTSTDMVFAGLADGSILAWKVTLDASAGGGGLGFQPAASLGGHTAAVVSLAVGNKCTRLYSGSADGTIRAWDLATLQCIYAVPAHDGVVTSVVCWDRFLLSSSLDGTIKAWTAVAKEGETEGDGGGLREVYARHEGQGVLLLNGTRDTDGRDVLMCSLPDFTVRLYDLPSFSNRGRIASRGEARAMHTGPHHFFFIGTATGEIGVCRWSQK